MFPATNDGGSVEGMRAASGCVRGFVQGFIVLQVVIVSPLPCCPMVWSGRAWLAVASACHLAPAPPPRLSPTNPAT